MGDISKNFNRSEFACKCGCGYDNVDAMTLEIVQSVRDHFAESVTITSGCRCPEYNAVVGGSKNSQHVKGRAADIVVANVSPALVADYIEDKYGDVASIGRYYDFTHVDTRSGHCARWGNN